MQPKVNRQHFPENSRRRALNEIEQRDHTEFVLGFWRRPTYAEAFPDQFPHVDPRFKANPG
jgi:hypothetical protein